MASNCEKCRDRAVRYVDGTLSEAESRKVREHLASCEACRRHVEQEQRLSQLLCAARSLDPAPDELRTRVQQLLAHAPEPAGFEKFRDRLRPLFPVRRRFLNAKVLAFAGVVVALGLILFIPIGQQVRAGTFVQAAVDAHHGYDDGGSPPDFKSGSPANVTAWIQERVPFHFQLPEAQHRPNEPLAYRLSGASIFNFKQKKVALVVYQMQTKKISLVVAPADLAILKGGQEVRLGKLTFHYRSSGDLEVITWSNHGLAYALVSPHQGSSAEGSCLVCHQDMADHGAFKQSGRVSFPRPWDMRR